MISFIIVIHGKYITSHESIYCFPDFWFFFLWITSHFCMFTANVSFWNCDLSYQLFPVTLCNSYLPHQDLTLFRVLIYTDPCVDNQSGHDIDPPMTINVSLPHITHMWCHHKLSLRIVYYPTLSFVFSDAWWCTQFNLGAPHF